MPTELTPVLSKYLQEYEHSACVLFWIPKRQAISTDTSFEIKMMVKTYAIKIIFRSHEPFQSYQLTDQQLAIWLKNSAH